MIYHFTQLPTPLGDRAQGAFSDEELMKMIQARSADGLGLLNDRYALLIKSISMQILHNDADTEDLLQDVLLEIWNRAASYDSQKGKPLGWIVTLTRRRSIDRLRRRDTYVRVENRLTEELKAGAEHWSHVYEDMALHDMGKYLNRALAGLPKAQRNALKMAYHKQMTQREIAARTGIPLGTVKTRLELGLRKMAASLHGQEDLIGASRRFRLGEYNTKATASTLATPISG
ncbi:MAG: sigma-70 family RNA polymerase sigma factor [Chthoniobacter sp.]|uniref:sigma-70 family RNA polymerase sigma factor n=1 Tax=Chthoniobacter sp. TaxID=2510640 RepID=UPI0032A28440